MTTGSNNPTDPRDTDAKLSLQQHQQLSALLDGDMAPDQARFVLRRLGHDTALAGAWQRWHLVGDVLRGHPVAGLPDSFAAGVAGAVAREGSQPAVRRAGWRQGIGVAAAASIAAVALLVARPALFDDPAPAPAMVAQPAVQPAPAIPAASPSEPVREVSMPQFAEAALPATTEPVAEGGPGRVAAASRREPEASGPLARPEEAGAGEPPAALVLAGDAAPFASPSEPQARPWPRATLPDLATPGSGPMTVGFGAGGAAPSFYPFDPEVPARADASGGDTPAGDGEARP